MTERDAHPSVDGDDVEALVAALLEARAQALAAARDKPVPIWLSVLAPQTAIADGDDGLIVPSRKTEVKNAAGEVRVGWGLEYRPSSRIPGPFWGKLPGLLAQVSEPIERVLAEKYSRLRYPTISSVAVEALPVERTASFYGQALVQDYCGGLESLEHDQPDLARRLATELLEFCAMDTVVVVASVWIARVSLPDGAVTAGDVTVRPLNELELGESHERFQQLFTDGRMRDVETAAVEVRTSCPNEPDSLGYGYGHQKILLALTLLGYEVTGLGVCRVAVEPPAARAEPVGPMRIPVMSPQMRSSGGSKPLREQQLREVVTLARHLNDSIFEEPTSRQDAAIRRFRLAASREDYWDAVVDVATAFEAVLLPGISSELRYRFCLNGAFLLGGTDADERARVFAALEKVYDVRSGTVHGGGARSKKGPDDDDLFFMAHIELWRLRETLVRCLREGWPDSPAMKQQILAGGSDDWPVER